MTEKLESANLRAVEERPLTTAQVAALLGVSPETVVNYGEKGDLRGFKLPGGHWRFRREDVDRLLDSGAGSKAAS